MKDLKASRQEFKYQLRNVVDYAPSDPRGAIPGEKTITLTEDIANQLNRARATNGNTLRLVKVD